MPKTYDEKRDFKKTPEPKMQKQKGGGPLTFVIQKHAATSLHYDFRIELDGVLKSWAVPKGPSYNPKDKRLAMMVEDHPLDYASFEGIIPKGNYGAGEVIVWDNGIYSPDEDGRLLFYDREDAQEEMRKGLAKGKISLFLRGTKMKGSWALVQMKGKKNESAADRVRFDHHADGHFFRTVAARGDVSALRRLAGKRPAATASFRADRAIARPPA